MCAIIINVFRAQFIERSQLCVQ